VVGKELTGFTASMDKAPGAGVSRLRHGARLAGSTGSGAVHRLRAGQGQIAQTRVLQIIYRSTRIWSATFEDLRETNDKIAIRVGAKGHPGGNSAGTDIRAPQGQAVGAVVDGQTSEGDPAGDAIMIDSAAVDARR